MPLRVALPPFNLLAFATLPRWARRMYGIRDTPATDLTATAALHAARRASTGLPGRLIYEPAVRRIFTVARNHSSGVPAAVPDSPEPRPLAG
jgi:hypothetical protein